MPPQSLVLLHHDNTSIKERAVNDRVYTKLRVRLQSATSSQIFGGTWLTSDAPKYILFQEINKCREEWTSLFLKSSLFRSFVPVHHIKPLLLCNSLWFRVYIIYDHSGLYNKPCFLLKSMATQGIYSSPTNKEDWLVIQDSDGLVNLSVGDWVNNYLSQAKQNGGGVIFDQITTSSITSRKVYKALQILCPFN